MEITQIVITSALTTLVGAVVGALVASAISYFKSVKQGHDDTNDAIRDGMRALLWRELKNIHSEAAARGGMDTEERKHLESVYKAYHGIGGNGTGTRLYEDAMNKPLID